MVRQICQPKGLVKNLVIGLDKCNLLKKFESAKGYSTDDARILKELSVNNFSACFTE
jgi:hypothetical protein